MNPSTTESLSTKTAESGTAAIPLLWRSRDRERAVRLFRSLTVAAPFQLRGRLLLLLLVLLAGLAGALAYYAPHAAEPSVGIDLPAEEPSLNLNLTSAEAPPSPSAPAPPPEADRSKVVVQESSAPALSAPLVPDRVISTGPATPVVAAPAALDLGIAGPAIPLPAVSLENCYSIRTPHRGDSPMIRNWKMLGLPLVLAVALTAQAADTGQAAQKPAEPNSNDVIIKDLGELRKAVEGLSTAVKGLQAVMLNADIEHKGEIAELRRSLGQLRQELDKLKERTATERRSAYPPNPPPPAPTGRIRLVNTYPQPVTIVVNNRAVTLQPGETRTLDAVAVGPFTYEVLGIQPATSRTLDANETFTITVHPR